MDLDTGQLRALATAVDQGTFDAAAQVLHITPSAVSQRIKALELATGRVLLVRSRPVRPTEAGHLVLRLARQFDLLVSDVAAELAEEVVGPIPLAVAVNSDSLATWFLAGLGTTLAGIQLQVFREDQDRTAQLLRDGSVVAAVTTARSAVPGCTSTSLGVMRYRPTASPGFVARWFPHGVTVEALAAAPVVHFDLDDDLQRSWLRERAGSNVTPPAHHVPSTDAFEIAVRSGFGWGMLSEYQLAGRSTPRRQATDGGAGDDPAVVVVLETDAVVDVPLYWQRWKLHSPALDRLSDAVTTAARHALRQT